MMKVSLLLEAINRASGPIDAVARAIRRLGSDAAATARKVGSAIDGSTRSLLAQARSLGSRIAYLGDQARDAGHHFRTRLGEEGLDRASRSMSYLKRQISGLTGGLTLLKYASGAAVIGLGEEFVRGVYKAGGEAQRMLVTLTRIEGSAEKARRAMSWMTDFAMGAGANFAMPDIMRAYQMAQNFGMRPQSGSLEAFADIAAGERVPMKQVLYAVKDAMEGTSIRPLANLGIKMKQGKKKGEDNSYLFSIDDKFYTETSGRHPEEVLAKLVEIFRRKYGGLATAQAQTVPGGFEQMQKLLYLFQMKVANAGVLDWTLRRMNEFFAWVRKASADGSLDRLARQVANFITSTGDQLIGFLKATDWAAVAKDLRALGSGLQALGSGLQALAAIGGGGLSGLFNLWIISKITGTTAALVGLTPVIAEVLTMMLGFEIAGGPIAWVITLIGALVLVGYLLWANWGAVSKWFLSMWQSLAAWLQRFFNALPGWMQAAGTIGGQIMQALGAVLVKIPPLVEKAWEGLKSWFSGFFSWLAGWQPPAWMSWLSGMAGKALAFTPLGIMAAAGKAAFIASTTSGPKPTLGAPRAAPSGNPGAGGAGGRTQVGGTITIDLKGAPAGTRVTDMRTTNPNVDLRVRQHAVGGQ